MTGPATMPLVVFRVGRARFGVDAHRVREMVWLPELSAVEEAPREVLGTFALRGAVIPVIDLRARFGHPLATYTADASVIVLTTAAGSLGVVADEVLDVGPATVVPHAHEVERDLVRAEATVDGHVVMVLDADRVWAGREGAAGSDPLMAAGLLPDPMAEPVLRDRARHYATVVAAPTVGIRLDLVVVALDEEWFGLSLTEVREFAAIDSFVRIPCCPPHVLGSMNLRGELVTLMDIRPALGLAAPDHDRLTDAVVVDVADQLLGLAVTALIDVVVLAAAEILPAPPAATQAGQRHVVGQVAVGDRMVTLLDVPTLLAEGGLDVDEVV